MIKSDVLLYKYFSKFKGDLLNWENYIDSEDFNKFENKFESLIFGNDCFGLKSYSSSLEKLLFDEKVGLFMQNSGRYILKGISYSEKLNKNLIVGGKTQDLCILTRFFEYLKNSEELHLYKVMCDDSLTLVFDRKEPLLDYDFKIRKSKLMFTSLDFDNL